MAYRPEPVRVLHLDEYGHKTIVFRVSDDGSMGHEKNGKPRVVYSAAFVDDPTGGYGTDVKTAMDALADNLEKLAKAVRAGAEKL